MSSSSSDPESSASATADVTSPPPMFATRVRQQLTPYLPPPVVKAMRSVDPALEPFLGPEASTTIGGTLVMAWLVWTILSKLIGLSSSSTKAAAIQDDPEDDAIVDDGKVAYDGTVLLCGPPQAGKTSLFYALVHPTSSSASSIPTISSIKPNTGYAAENNGSSTRTLRYLDAPGHWGASKLTSTVVEGLAASDEDKVVLVLDATQPVAKAADYLLALLRSSSDRKILVACHKSKLAKAKNLRRIKLQLRNELDRLSSLEAKANGSGAPASDWEAVLREKVGFLSTSVDPPVLDGLREYIATGTLPAQ